MQVKTGLNLIVVWCYWCWKPSCGALSRDGSDCGRENNDIHRTWNVQWV